MVSNHLNDDIIAYYQINLMTPLLHFTFVQKVKIVIGYLESESFKYILVTLLFGFEWHKDGNHLFRVLLKSVSYVFRGFVTEWSEILRGKFGKKKTFVFWENRLFWLRNLKQKEKILLAKDLKNHDLKWMWTIDGTDSAECVDRK